MKDLKGFLEGLPDVKDAAQYGVYEKSVNQSGSMWVFMIREADDDYIVAAGEGSEAFQGEAFECAGMKCVKAPKTAETVSVYGAGAGTSQDTLRGRGRPSGNRSARSYPGIQQV